MKTHPYNRIIESLFYLTEEFGRNFTKWLPFFFFFGFSVLYFSVLSKFSVVVKLAVKKKKMLRNYKSVFTFLNEEATYSSLPWNNFVLHIYSFHIIQLFRVYTMAIIEHVPFNIQLFSWHYGAISYVVYNFIFITL